MSKRLLLIAVLGAVAMFLWQSIAHMALPLGEAGIRQIENEQALLGAMQSTISSHGFYIFPNMPPGNDQAAYEQRIANGPSGMMIYFPRREFNFGRLLGIEFVSEFLQVLLAASLLSMTRVSKAGPVLAFFALLGAIAAISTNVSYWNWYGFPVTYTAASIVTTFVGYIFAGLVAALIVARQPRHLAATA